MTTESRPPETLTIDLPSQPRQRPRWWRIKLRIALGALVAVVVLVGLVSGVA